MPAVCGAAEDVQGGVVLPVVRVQLQHQAAVAHPLQKHVGQSLLQLPALPPNPYLGHECYV